MSRSNSIKAYSTTHTITALAIAPTSSFEPPLPKHEPLALVTVHTVSPSRSLVDKVVTLCCFPHPRKHSKPHPYPRTPTSCSSASASCLPPPPRLSTEPVFDSASCSTYTSFPAPTFTTNGQPRALDSRLYPDLAFPPKSSFQRQRRQQQERRGQGSAELRFPALRCPYLLKDRRGKKGQ